MTERELRSATTTGRTVIAPADHTAQLRYSWFPSAAAAADPDRARGARGSERRALGGRPLTAAGLRGPDRRPLPSDDDLPPLTAAPFDVLGPHHVDHVLATAYPRGPPRRRAGRRRRLRLDARAGARAPPSRGSRWCAAASRPWRGCSPTTPGCSLWAFGTHPRRRSGLTASLRPDGDLEGDGRRTVEGAIDTLTPTDTGTGLHDTVLAAYRSAQAAYREGTPSHAVVFTDGAQRGRQPHALPRPAPRRAEAAADPRRPVNLAVITFGAEPDAEALQKAVEPVQGYVDRLTTADEVGAAFIHLAAGGLHG